MVAYYREIRECNEEIIRRCDRKDRWAFAAFWAVMAAWVVVMFWLAVTHAGADR